MTKEEAIKIAQGLITDFKCESETMVDFCNVIIKALKQEPCDDYISRQAVLEVLKKNRYRFNISQEGYCEGKVLWSENLIKDDACKEIKQLPSVTPKEKTGQWIENASEYQNIDPPYICSECGNMHLRKTNYCDQCGARMVEPQESEVNK